MKAELSRGFTMEANNVVFNIAPAVTDLVGKLARKAFAFPIDNVITKYAREEGIPREVACSHAREVLRFLVLSAAYPDKHLPMVRTVDQFWHNFILHTTLYSAFCQEALGRYIHHEPMDIESKDAREMHAEYAELLELYSEHFGEEAPTHLWPNPRRASLSTADLTCGNSHDCFGRSCLSPPDP